jgi:hypothetical protein
MTTSQTWSSPWLNWGDGDDAGGMSEAVDSLDPRRGVVKPAATWGCEPSSVRGYGELARWTGRGLPSPDPYDFSYSARGAYDWSSYI